MQINTNTKQRMQKPQKSVVDSYSGLIGWHIRPRRKCIQITGIGGLFLEGQVHALVTAILFGMQSGLNSVSMAVRVMEKALYSSLYPRG